MCSCKYLIPLFDNTLQVPLQPWYLQNLSWEKLKWRYMTLLWLHIFGRPDVEVISRRVTLRIGIFVIARPSFPCKDLTERPQTGACFSALFTFPAFTALLTLPAFVALLTLPAFIPHDLFIDDHIQQRGTLFLQLL